MKKILIIKGFLLSYITFGSLCANVNAQTSFKAISDNGMAAEFENAVVNDGKSVVKVEKGNIIMTSVAGSTPANNPNGQPGQQITSDGTVIAWNDIKWDAKKQDRN